MRTIKNKATKNQRKEYSMKIRCRMATSIPFKYYTECNIGCLFRKFKVIQVNAHELLDKIISCTQCSTRTQYWWYWWRPQHFHLVWESMCAMYRRLWLAQTMGYNSGCCGWRHLWCSSALTQRNPSTSTETPTRIKYGDEELSKCSRCSTRYDPKRFVWSNFNAWYPQLKI